MVSDSVTNLTRWCLGPSPKSLDAENVEIIRQLFLDQPEKNASESVRTSQFQNGVEIWFYDSNNMIRGLLWVMVFKGQVRIVAL